LYESVIKKLIEKLIEMMKYDNLKKCFTYETRRNE